MQYSNVLIKFFLFFALAGHVFAQPLPPHPRIIFTPDAEQLLRKKLPEDMYLEAAHQSVLRAADRMLSLPPVERVQTGRRILSVSREALERITHYAYAYRLTEDKKYLQNAKSEMLAAAAFTDWNPSHFLDVAELTTALAIGYDWLYSDIEEEARMIIRKAIIEKGLKPSFEYDDWTRAHHNWNQVCNGGMVLGALAIFEEDAALAAKIIARADTSLALPMEDYGPDGAYPEGPGYWSYGTTYHAIVIDATRTALGNDKAFAYSPAFIGSAWYKLHMLGPAGYFNYSDNSFTNSLNPVMCWFAAEANNPEVLWSQQPFFDAMTEENAVFSSRFTPFMPIWASRLNSLVFLKPDAMVWSGKGISPVAVMRGSWDVDGIFVGIKGGSPSANHGHMDAGTFVMDAMGVRWAFDLGGHPYHPLEARGLDIWSKGQESERWQIMRYNNFFHNTLVVNMSLQKADSYSPLTSVTQTGDILAATVDISPAYAGYLSRAVRTLSLVNNHYVRITDNIKNGSLPATVQWNMITADSITLSDPHLAVIHQEGKALEAIIETPYNATWFISSTHPDNNFEYPNPGTARLGFKASMAKEEEAVFSVVLKPVK